MKRIKFQIILQGDIIYKCYTEKYVLEHFYTVNRVEGDALNKVAL